MAMGHVILREFFVDRQVPYFSDYVSRYTDLPFLIKLDPGSDGSSYVPGKFLTAEDLGGDEAASENAAFKTVLLDAATGAAVVPNGSLGHRFGDEGVGRWNLDLGDVAPLLSAADGDDPPVTVQLPRFDDARRSGSGARARRPDPPGRTVTWSPPCST